MLGAERAITFEPVCGARDGHHRRRGSAGSSPRSSSNSARRVTAPAGGAQDLIDAVAGMVVDVLCFAAAHTIVAGRTAAAGAAGKILQPATRKQ